MRPSSTRLITAFAMILLSGASARALAPVGDAFGPAPDLQPPALILADEGGGGGDGGGGDGGGGDGGGGDGGGDDSGGDDSGGDDSGGDDSGGDDSGGDDSGDGDDSARTAPTATMAPTASTMWRKAMPTTTRTTTSPTRRWAAGPRRLP